MTRRDAVSRELRARIMRRTSTHPNTCPTGKIQYISQREASAIIRGRHRRNDPEAEGLNAYRCNRCTKWHIGHGISGGPDP